MSEFFNVLPTVKKNTVAIADKATGELITYLRKDEVHAWMFKAERARKDAITDEQERRVARLNAINAYLAKRAERRELANSQLTLDF